MSSRDGLPRRVYVKHGRYYYVRPTDERWMPLTRVKQGLPAMFRALAELTDAETNSERMPAVIARWLEAKAAAGDWSSSTKDDMERVAARLGKALAQFTPRQLTPPACAKALAPLLAKPRTYNLYRSALRQVMSHAALEGLRDGHNPVDDVPPRKMKQRVRIVTVAELDAMAKALMQAARGGATHVRMLALCIKTGQRISDVLKLRAQDCADDGILVDQGKTGAPLLIEWDDELRTLVDDCFTDRDRIGHLLVQSTGKRYTYAGVRSAWVRAMARAGIEDLHIHDLRGEAGARIADTMGPYAAQTLLGHKSVTMTEGYIRGKTRRKATPAPMKKPA